MLRFKIHLPMDTLPHRPGMEDAPELFSGWSRGVLKFPPLPGEKPELAKLLLQKVTCLPSFRAKFLWMTGMARWSHSRWDNQVRQQAKSPHPKNSPVSKLTDKEKLTALTGLTKEPVLVLVRKGSWVNEGEHYMAFSGSFYVHKCSFEYLSLKW